MMVHVLLRLLLPMLLCWRGHFGRRLHGCTAVAARSRCRRWCRKYVHGSRWCHGLWCGVCGVYRGVMRWRMGTWRLRSHMHMCWNRICCGAVTLWLWHRVRAMRRRRRRRRCRWRWRWQWRWRWRWVRHPSQHAEPSHGSISVLSQCRGAILLCICSRVADTKRKRGHCSSFAPTQMRSPRYAWRKVDLPPWRKWITGAIIANFLHVPCFPSPSLQ